MIQFYDVPVKVPAPTIPTTDVASAKNAIHLAFRPFLTLGTASTLHIHLADIAAALAADANYCLIPAASHALCASVLADQLGDVHGNEALEHLPTHFRRVMSELVAAATSLAVMEEDKKYVFYCSVRQFSTVWNLKDVIVPLWDGSGPDYVCAKFDTEEISLLESKGVFAEVTPTPRNFEEYKAQSMNAQAAFAVTAKYLSYVHLQPKIPLVCRFFNDRLDRPARQHKYSTHQIGLLIAFTHFTNQMQHAGLFELSTEFRRTLSANLQRSTPLEGDRSDVMLVLSGKAVYRPSGQSVFIEIDSRSIALFTELAMGGWWRNLGRARELALRLAEMARTVRETPPEPGNARRLYTSATGISYFIVGQFGNEPQPGQASG